MVYKTKHIKPKTVDYDAIIIGSGSGGGVAAHTLQRKGQNIAVVEQEKIGGECPNYGCIPTKALLQSADTLNTIKRAADFGIKVGSVSVDHKALKAWKNKAVRNTGTSEGEEAFAADGITVLKGHAHFIDPWTVSIKGRRFTANKFLIATGTHDVVPPIPGLKETGFIGYRQALDLEQHPKKIFIIGGGAIGCEFAHIFSSFGSEVHLAEFAPRLIYREDPEIGELMAAVFESNGVNVYTDSRVVSVQEKGGKKEVTYNHNGKNTKVLVDEILLAAGKAPNTDIGLDNAGVDHDNHGIKVDRFMQTTAPHIFAAGDVTGKYMFTHVAGYQSRIAAQNMCSSLKHQADYHAVPRCVFISPEIAAVGATEEELKAKNVKYQVGAVPLSIVSRANTAQEDTGFVKILASKTGVILGASIVAPRAGELIHELTLAVQWRMKASKIQYTIHAFPTWSQAVRMAASKITCR
ncbi:MAG: dihydrolipoamide dehydrogenase [Candidatus Saccharimonadales bacterium]